jgi:hypothetical protein
MECHLITETKLEKKSLQTESKRKQVVPQTLYDSIKARGNPFIKNGIKPISIIRRRNEACKDVLQRGHNRRRFGSGPSSKTFVDHDV